MNNDTMKDIIRDAHALSRMQVAEDLVRAGIETIASRLERLVADNSSLQDSETPSDSPAPQASGRVSAEHELRSSRKAPSESNADSFRKFLTVKWLGMEFRRFKSNAETLYVATWRNDETKDSHVYEVRVKRDGDSPNCGWIAQATNNGGRVFSLSAKNRSYCELCALSAMKRYLSRGHRGPYRKRHSRVAPLSPEAELAATVARQKEAV